jgi:peroxidase
MNRNRRRILSRTLRRNPELFTQHAADVLEPRQMLSATAAAAPAASSVESFNGSGNNITHPTWGTAGTDLLRISAAQYANGINSPSLPQNPSARVVSNILNSQSDPANSALELNTIDKNSLSDFGYAFGQFMDHDLDLTQGSGASDPISVPAGDPIGGPNDTPLAFNRSASDPSTGTSTSNPLQNPNSITSYFDLSQLYGSDKATDDALRTFSGGQMKTSPGGLPPLDNSTYFTAAQLSAINAAEGGMANNGPAPTSTLFVTGDTRGNENVELTSLQALFLDNHNKIAAQLQKQNPSWTDEQLFQEARKLNIAEYQSIIYNEWIPAVLGQNALPAYRGYNPNVNASIADEFSTVAFRFGHSLLSGQIARAGNNGQAVAGAVPLSQDFFDPAILNGQGQPSVTDPYTGLQSTDIGAILKADADGVSQAMDPMAINEVRNLLFNEVVPGQGFGQDLMALDVQRARDQGIGSYNQLREAYGLPPVTSFAQITSNVQVQQELQQAYGNVNNIDPFEGGVAEDHVKGSDVGPLFQAIMVNQFARLRDGDRFFFLNENFTPAERAILQQGSSLAKVIEGNTNITNLQSDVFLFQTSISGRVTASAGRLTLGVPGITVQLEDTDGNVLATTTTNRLGQYTFNQLSGGAANGESASGTSETGTYHVALSLPSFLTQITTPGDVTITRGGQTFTNVDFQLGLNFDGGDQPMAHANLAPGHPTSSGTLSSTTGTSGDATTGTTVSPVTGSQSDPSQSWTALTGTSTTAMGSAIASSDSWTTQFSSGFIDSTNSSGAGSGGAGGSSNASDKPLDAAFQEFGKIADLLK